MNPCSLARPLNTEASRGPYSQRKDAVPTRDALQGQPPGGQPPGGQPPGGGSASWGGQPPGGVSLLGVSLLGVSLLGVSLLEVSLLGSASWGQPPGGQPPGGSLLRATGRPIAALLSLAGFCLPAPAAATSEWPAAQPTVLSPGPPGTQPSGSSQHAGGSPVGPAPPRLQHHCSLPAPRSLHLPGPPSGSREDGAKG